MQLVMYAGNDFIASAHMDASRLSVPGYVGQLKRKLLEDNRALWQLTTDEPEFLVIDPAHPLPNEM